ncbi:30S ribosomal protein S6 alpha, chloroplastic-like protein [Tanacetum coccineum]
MASSSSPLATSPLLHPLSSFPNTTKPTSLHFQTHTPNIHKNPFSVKAQTLDFSGTFFEGGLGGEDDMSNSSGSAATAVEEKEEPQCPPGLRQYETMAVLRPDMSEDERLSLTQKYEELLVAGGGMYVEVFNRGVIPLAYSIKKKNKAGETNTYLDGIYLLFTYFTKPESLEVLETTLNMDDDVIRSSTFVVRKRKLMEWASDLSLITMEYGWQNVLAGTRILPRFSAYILVAEHAIKSFWTLKMPHIIDGHFSDMKKNGKPINTIASPLRTFSNSNSSSSSSIIHPRNSRNQDSSTLPQCNETGSKINLEDKLIVILFDEDLYSEDSICSVVNTAKSGQHEPPVIPEPDTVINVSLDSQRVPLEHSAVIFEGSSSSSMDNKLSHPNQESVIQIHDS